MNLYSINFEHWSPKDSREGIYGHLIAETEEAVLDYLIANSKYETQSGRSFLMGNYWGDGIDDLARPKMDDDDDWRDDNDEFAKETKRERLLRLRGELYDEEKLDGLSDLYYGATLVGWNLIRENITDSEAAVLVKLSVAIQLPASTNA